MHTSTQHHQSQITPPVALRPSQDILMGGCSTCRYRDHAGSCAIRRVDAVPLIRPTHCRLYWPVAQGTTEHHAS